MAELDHLEIEELPNPAKEKTNEFATWLKDENLKWQLQGDGFYECIDEDRYEKIASLLKDVNESHPQHRIFRVSGSKYATIVASGGHAHIYQIQNRGKTIATVDGVPLSNGCRIGITRAVHIGLGTDFMISSRGQKHVETSAST